MKNLNKTQKALISVNSLRTILSLFTSTFLTSYIISLNPENVLTQGLINIGTLLFADLLAYIVVYYFLSKLVDKSNRVSFLRISIIINTILLVCIVFFGEQLSQWIPIAGALVGISNAFYNSSYVVMRNELIGRKQINTYTILVNVLSNVINIFVPIVLGYLIDVSTYSNIAIYVIIISIIQYAVSYLIKSSRPQGSAFELNKFLKLLKSDKFVRDKIKYTYYNALAAGAKDFYKTLIIILTIYTFKTNLSLGIFTSVFSIVTTILLLIYKKFEDKNKIKRLPVNLIIGIFPVVSCLLFLITKGIVALTILNLAMTIAILFSDYISACDRDAVIKNLNKYEYIAEHQFLFELFVNIIKGLVCILLIVVGITGLESLFYIYLLLLMLACPVKYLIMYKQSQIREELSNTKELMTSTKPEFTE